MVWGGHSGPLAGRSVHHLHGVALGPAPVASISQPSEVPWQIAKLSLRNDLRVACFTSAHVHCSELRRLTTTAAKEAGKHSLQLVAVCPAKMGCRFYHKKEGKEDGHWWVLLPSVQR